MEKLPEDRVHYVMDNINLVHYVLHAQMHINRSDQNYDDYFQEGVIGLILSAIRFNESFGNKFSTYAIPNIHGTILRYKRENMHLIHYSTKIKDVLFQVMKYINQGYTPEEISELTGFSLTDVQDAYIVNNISSIDQPYELNDKGEKNLTIGDTLASKEDLYQTLLDEQYIYSIIQKVSDSIKNERDRGIWEEYVYGAIYGENLTQQYFADKYNLSQSHISRTLRKYKKMFSELLLD